MASWAPKGSGAAASSWGSPMPHQALVPGVRGCVPATRRRPLHAYFPRAGAYPTFSLRSTHYLRHRFPHTSLFNCPFTPSPAAVLAGGCCLHSRVPTSEIRLTTKSLAQMSAVPASAVTVMSLRLPYRRLIYYGPATSRLRTVGALEGLVYASVIM